MEILYIYTTEWMPCVCACVGVCLFVCTLKLIKAYQDPIPDSVSVLLINFLPKIESESATTFVATTTTIPLLRCKTAVRIIIIIMAAAEVN